MPSLNARKWGYFWLFFYYLAIEAPSPICYPNGLRNPFSIEAALQPRPATPTTPSSDSDDPVQRLRRRLCTRRSCNPTSLRPATAPRRHPLAWGEEDNEEDFFGLTLTLLLGLGLLLLGLGLLGVCGSVLWFLFYMNWIHFFVKHEVVINLLSTTCHVTATYARF